MKKQLISCIDPDEVVSIYCDTDRPDTHLTGFIGYYSEELLIINHISKEGHYDGFVIIDPSDIFRIDYGGEYEKKVKALYRYKMQSHPQLTLGDCAFDSLLSFCQKGGYVISVELGDSILIGLLIDYNENNLHMHLLDSYGRDNGKSILAYEEIRSLAVDTSTERDIGILHKVRLEREI